MRIDVEVFGTLRGKLPDDDGRGKGSYEVADGASISDAFRQLEIPPEIRYIIMVNGKQESDRERALQDGDKLTVLPPVAGGSDGPSAAPAERPRADCGRSEPRRVARFFRRRAP